MPAPRVYYTEAIVLSRFELGEAALCRLDTARLLDAAAYVVHLARHAGVRPSWGAHFDEYGQRHVGATQLIL